MFIRGNARCAGNARPAQRDLPNSVRRRFAKCCARSNVDVSARLHRELADARRLPRATPQIAHNPCVLHRGAPFRRAEQQSADGSRARAEQCRGVRRRRVDRHDDHDRHRLSREDRRRAPALAARHESAKRPQHQADRSVGVSEDLLAYLQSPQGKVLTEAPALAAGGAARDGRAAPAASSGRCSRASCSARSARANLGQRNAGEPKWSTFLNGVGVVVLMIGIGFAVSAVVSYFLSQRLGMVQPLSARYSGDTPTP